MYIYICIYIYIFLHDLLFDLVPGQRATSNQSTLRPSLECFNTDTPTVSFLPSPRLSYLSSTPLSSPLYFFLLAASPPAIESSPKGV